MARRTDALGDAEIDLAVSDLLDVDRTVPWGVACAVVGHLRIVEYGRPDVRVRALVGGRELETKVPIPHETNQEGFEGDALAAEILYGSKAKPSRTWVDRYVGEELARRYEDCRVEVDDWRLPPAPYASSWDAAMAVRRWVQAGGIVRGGRLAILLMTEVASHDADLQRLMQGPAAQDPSMQIHLVTQTGLAMTPRDLCLAALAVSLEERREMGVQRRIGRIGAEEAARGVSQQRQRPRPDRPPKPPRS